MSELADCTAMSSKKGVVASRHTPLKLLVLASSFTPYTTLACRLMILHSLELRHRKT